MAIPTIPLGSTNEELTGGLSAFATSEPENENNKKAPSSEVC